MRLDILLEKLQDHELGDTPERLEVDFDKQGYLVVRPKYDYRRGDIETYVDFRTKDIDSN